MNNKIIYLEDKILELENGCFLAEDSVVFLQTQLQLKERQINRIDEEIC